MASAYNLDTARRIYDAIAASGKLGLDAEQLTNAVKLARNTVLIYTRRLEDDGCLQVELEPQKGKAPKNVYLAVKPPIPKLDPEARLRRIADLLEPIGQYSGDWNKASAEIAWRVQQALKIAGKSA